MILEWQRFIYPLPCEFKKTKWWQMDDLVPQSHISRHESPAASAGSTCSHFNVPQLHQQSDISLLKDRGLTEDMNQPGNCRAKGCVNISLS